MPVVNELLRADENGTLSFGNYEPVSYTHLRAHET